MLTVIIAVIVLAIAIFAIYWLLKSMGEEGIEVAAPGSCKSGRCGVRRDRVAQIDHEQGEDASAERDGPKDSR
jgi:hypothetical protein